MKEEANIKVDFKRITLGNVLSIATMIASVFLAYSSIKSELAVMSNDIAWIKSVLSDKMNIVSNRH